MAKTLAKLEDGTKSSDFLIRTCAVEEIEGKRGDLHEMVEAYIRSGYKAIGFADRYCHAAAPDEVKRLCLARDGIAQEAEDIAKLRSKYGDQIKIFFGLYFDTSFQNPERLDDSLFNIFDEHLDYLLLANVHSKQDALNSAAIALESAHQIRGLRQGLLEILKASTQGRVPQEGETIQISDNAKLTEIQMQLKSYATILNCPTYPMNAVVDAATSMPHVRVGIISDSISQDFRGYTEADWQYISVLKRAIFHIAGQDVPFGKALNTILACGVPPENFAQLLQDNGMFVMMPFNHNSHGVVDLRTVPDERTAAFLNGAGPYAAQIKDKKIPLLPGSAYPVNDQLISSGLDERLGALKEQGYAVSTLAFDSQ